MDAWTLALGGALALSILVVGIARLRRPRVRLVKAAPPRPPRAIPLVAQPDEAALAALPRPIHACPDCGYIGIRPLRIGDGGFVAGDLYTTQLCPHCGYQGPPAEFDEPEDYAEYTASLHRAWRRP